MRTTAIALVAVLGCGSSGGQDIPQGYVPLVTGEWQMDPGHEGYWCVRATADEDLYIKSFKPIAPKGTHHTALSLSGGPHATSANASSIALIAVDARPVSQ